MTGHDDADPDDTGLDGLRSMWRSLPDEEPPARGLDALMAAARIQAEAMAPPSLWDRFIAMIRQPQVLALATIMILIGGAVFISQRRDMGEAAQPTSGDDQGMQERAGEQAPAAVTAPAPMNNTPGADEAEGRRSGAASTGSAMVSGGEASRDERKGGSVRPTAVAPKSAASPKKPVAKKSASTPSKSKEESKPGVGPETSSALSVDSLEDAEADKAAPQPKAARPDATATPTVQQLHSQARAAAARNDCATVKALAKKIAAQDAPYYRANIAPDTTLAACLN